MSSTFAVIFDNDGVLVDSEAISIEAYQRAIEEQGVVVQESDNEKYCGLTDADIIRDMEIHYGTHLDLEKFSSRKRDLYFELAEKSGMKRFPGALELLRDLRAAGVPYALASSGSQEKIEFNLRAAGLDAEFDIIISGQDFERGKPDPEIFLCAAKRVETPTERCIVLEDSVNGLKAAKAAGCFAVGVPNTFQAGVLARHADTVVDTLTALSASRLGQMIGLD
ncbi:MAG: HAD family phosphatase [Candidatus Sumerlaeaceae bacterium]|nr:HAD family phosphatase [Candidatus Sumerlaeaceae bacterium]